MRVTLTLFLVSALILGGCVTTPAGKSEPADLLIRGGTILTMAGENLSDGAVAVRNGEIIAVGPRAELENRFSARQHIEARGMVVMPGLVNAHTHAPMTLFRGIADDRDLMDWLQNFIFPAEKNNVDAEFVRWGTRLAAAEMIRSGTTTFADMYYFEADIARETKKAGLRAVLGETLIDFPAPDNKTWDEAMAYMRRYATEFKNDPLITPAVAPHAPFTVSKEHLIAVRALARELGIPILIHLSETEDELRQVGERSGGLKPGAYLDSIEFLDTDVVAAHGVWLSSAEITTLAAKGVGVVHNPESNMMLASGIAPVIEMRAAGIDVGLGTDGPAGSNNNLDMFEEMASAARLQKIASRDPKALSARDVLEMATISGARCLGLEDKIGTIEVGKRADIIVVDLRQARTQPVYSVESTLVYASSGDDVVTTIVDGKVLMLNRRMLTLNVDEILSQAEVYRARVSDSLKKPR